MYLFSRRARLNGAEDVEWATKILGRVKEVTGSDVRLWTHVFSPGLGTISWTSWWADLPSLETAMGTLQSDSKFTALAAEGRTHIDGTVDDSLLQLVSGEFNPSAGDDIQYVAGAQAVCAAGNVARAMTVGIELAQKGEAITGMRTLFVRFDRQSANAMTFAAHFEKHSKVERVIYPGLPSHPAHAIAKRQMTGGFGGMLSILTKGGFAEAQRVAASVKVFYPATSLGGVESLVEHRKTVEAADSPIPANLIRISIGIENVSDLIADFEQALESI